MESALLLVDDKLIGLISRGRCFIYHSVIERILAKALLAPPEEIHFMVAVLNGEEVVQTLGPCRFRSFTHNIEIDQCTILEGFKIEDMNGDLIP